MAEKKYQVVLLTMDKDSERRVESKMKKVFFYFVHPSRLLSYIKIVKGEWRAK